MTIEFWWRQIFEILIIHKPSLWSRDVPQKIGPDRFSRFDVYWIQTNKQTPKHQNIQAKFIYWWRNFVLIVVTGWGGVVVSHRKLDKSRMLYAASLERLCDLVAPVMHKYELDILEIQNTCVLLICSSIWGEIIGNLQVFNSTLVWRNLFLKSYFNHSCTGYKVCMKCTSASAWDIKYAWSTHLQLHGI